MPSYRRRARPIMEAANKAPNEAGGVSVGGPRHRTALRVGLNESRERGSSSGFLCRKPVFVKYTGVVVLPAAYRGRGNEIFERAHHARRDPADHRFPMCLSGRRTGLGCGLAEGQSTGRGHDRPRRTRLVTVERAGIEVVRIIESHPTRGFRNYLGGTFDRHRYDRKATGSGQIR